MDQQSVKVVGEGKPPPARRTPGRRMWPAHGLEHLQPYLYLLPALITVGLWIYKPLVQTFELSFYQWNLLPTSPKTFVGWENFLRLLQLPEVGQALWNTLLYTVGMVPLTILIPLAVALITDDIRGHLRALYRTLIFVPMIMAPVVVAVVWRWLLAPSQGLVNKALDIVFSTGPIYFLGSEQLALWVILFITGWKLLGFSTLIFAAAIAGINKEYLEAASLDGASRWQLVRHLKLPLLSPTIWFMTLLSVLLSSQWTFVYVNVLTEGGPLNATTNIFYLLWEFGFSNFNIGWSSAAAALLFVGFGLLALVFLHFMNRYSFYDR